MPNKYEVVIPAGKRKECPGDALPVREPRTFTRDYSLSVRVEFSEKPTKHEHRIVKRHLFEPTSTLVTKEPFNKPFDYDEGERLCGSTDATVTVTVSVDEEQDNRYYAFNALPSYGISKRLPVFMMMNIVDHLKMWLPKSLPDLACDLCDEGQFGMRGDSRTWHIERIRDKAAVLARKRLRVVRDSGRAEELRTARRDDFIGRSVRDLQDLNAQRERISKAALARKQNRGSDREGKSTRTQAMNKTLRRYGIKWEELLKEAGVNLTQKLRR